MCQNHSSSFISDPNSFANIHQLRTTHIHLNVAVNFEENILKGHVVHTLLAVEDHVSELILDTRYMEVQAVYRLALSSAVADRTASSNSSEHPLSFELKETNDMYGTPLKISLDHPLKKHEQVVLKIVYNTTPKCTAVQWLTPEQTVGKQKPYMFTQCQAIHARSLVPCQDTPNVKITYSAEIRVPKTITVIMSALEDGHDIKSSSSENIFKFKQPCGIPSYLIALAAGNLASKEIGPRTKVWSEPEVVEQAAWEFVDTEKFIATGEDLLTPYSWKRYDLLLLPASFPYGGMENPCLTFVTPTLLAGDRSLVDVVAHEIAHSWMGNLVTTANWEHFWLNEGFTVFIERKIVGRLHGDPELHFSAILGLKALKESIEHYKEINKMEYTALVPSLKNVDPDDAFSSIPYEKGYNFLFYLEHLLGGPTVFEPFVKSYVSKFAGKSISTADFKSYLFEYYSSDADLTARLNQVDWNTWFYGLGMPPVENTFNDILAKECQALADKWDFARNSPQPAGFTKADLEKLSPSQKIVFLEKMLEKPKFPHTLLKSMDAIYEMNQFQNAEIKFRWQWLCLQSDWQDIFPHVVSFITSVGRMKFVRPLYRALSKCTNGNALAKETFIQHKSFYHPIAGQMISKDLNVPY